MSVFLGARTLSWPTLGLLAIAGLLAAAASSPEASLRDRLLWIGIGLIAQVALTAVYVLGAKVGAARSRVAVLAVVVLGALARALSLAWLVASVGLADPLPPGQRIVSATVTFAAWGLLFGAMVQGWSDYRESLRALLLRVDRAVEDARALGTEWQTRLLSTGTTPTDLARTAQALHEDIAQRLRPLSHRLWFGITGRQTRREFIRAFMTQPIPVGWLALTTTAVYTWTASYQFGFAMSVLGGVATAAIDSALLLTAAALSRRYSRHQIRIRGVALVLLLFVPVLVNALLPSFRDSAGLGVTIAGLAALVFVVQAIAVSVRQRRAQLTSLGQQVDALDVERRQLAAHLHTTVQSRWTAAAIRLQAAAETGDVESAARALREAREVVADSAPSGQEPTDLNRLARAWEGIAAIHLQIPPDVPSSVRPTLGLLIEEAINNAIRHGHARTIDVLVTVAASSVDVVVVDDGVGVAESHRVGLGSRWMDAVSRWEIAREVRGSRFSASIALERE